jgi:Flp pilus assembly protein TadD
MRGEYGKAIKKYERVVAIDPEDAEAEYRLGLAYLAQGEKEKAMAVHARLRALNRGYAEMLRRLSER